MLSLLHPHHNRGNSGVLDMAPDIDTDIVCLMKPQFIPFKARVQFRYYFHIISTKPGFVWVLFKCVYKLTELVQRQNVKLNQLTKQRKLVQ